MKVHYTDNIKNAIRCVLKRSNFQQSGRKTWNSEKENIIMIRKKNSQLKLDRKMKKNLQNSTKIIWKIEHLISHIRKQKVGKILMCN